MNVRDFTQEQGSFGEELIGIIAQKNNLGEDVSHLFRAGRGGIDAAFLATDPAPRLTIVESKTSCWGTYPYSRLKKQGGSIYFRHLLKSLDYRHRDIQLHFQKLICTYPELNLHFIRVETLIELTEDRFVVEDLKVKSWKDSINK
ncbi:hypothetical protein [Paenibacillus sp. Z6-24]